MYIFPFILPLLNLRGHYHDWKTVKASRDIHARAVSGVLLTLSESCVYKQVPLLLDNYAGFSQMGMYQKNILQKIKVWVLQVKPYSLRNSLNSQKAHKKKHQEGEKEGEKTLQILSFLYALHFVNCEIIVKSRFRALRLHTYRWNRSIKLKHYHSRYYTQRFLFPSLGWAISMALLPCQEHLWT